MRPSAITEKEAIAALRYHFRLRRARQRRLAKAYVKIEKIQPRSYSITGKLAAAKNCLDAVARYAKECDKDIKKDTGNYQHLTGKPIDKTAGRNTLGLRNGK
jgi:hypothetical protein